MSALTIADVLAISAIVDYCQRNATVYWLDSVQDQDAVRSGTFRAIVDESGKSLSNDADVRDAYVRITDFYTESEMKVSEAIALYRNGELREDTRTPGR